MTRTSMKSAAIAVAAIGALTLSACSAGDEAVDGEIVIGVALPTTGGSAVLGEPMSQGIEMAVAEINAAGGINGSTVRVVQEDTGADDASALNAFNRITGENPAAVIGFPVSTQGFAVMTQVDRTAIPVIMGGTSATLALGSEWAFDMTSHDGITSTAAAQFAAEDLGVTKVALLRESGELGTGASEVVYDAAEEFGFEIVDEEIFQSGDVDLSTQANNLRSSDAEMLFVYGQQADYIVAANALATAGVALPTFVAGVQPGTFAQLNYDGFETIYNRNQCVPSAATEGDLFDWSAAYEEEFGGAPTEYAAIAYDGANLLFDAIENAGSTDAEAIQTALLELPASTGICGTHSGSESGQLSFSATIGHYEGDAYVTDKSIDVDPR
ncbi:ABC transporter substrate-binding protein [Salinibacterium sp. NK8237]|uniref:ABC transporter substrate-binding protein n=1 Tax=Salinibacterium sp. NK8237 TaxID=2792038 RepID=UPI0018CFE763|nr:ABC transporter substrate-binding protein [Salinibacterium sp. NK8237]MBH0130644.1 ABC transporter substrate-binding protein [Salinibacterium sp. NK8237]